MSFNITHATCSNTNGSITYTISLSNGWSQYSTVNSLTLYYDNQVTQTADPIFEHAAVFGSTAQSGNRSSLQPGHYYFSGSINTRDALGTSVVVTINEHLWIGYQTQWEDLNEMAVGSTAYTLYRNTTASGNTFGWARSFNTSGSNSGYGFLEFKKKAATSYPSTIYCLLDPVSNYSAFVPTGSFQYIEITETAANTGTIKLKYYNGSSYVTTTLSTSVSSKVRVQRNASSTSCQVQLNQSTTNVAPAFSVSGSLRVMIFAQQLNAEAQNVISTFPCEGQTLTWISASELKRELDGGYAVTVGGTLKFAFNEEYKIPGDQYIALSVYDLNQNVIASVSSSGTLTGATAAMRLPYVFDDNICQLPLTGVSGLTNGNYYLLEVKTSTGEKRYLRFLYTN